MDSLNYRKSLEEVAKIRRNRMTRYREVIDFFLKNVKGQCLEIGCGDGLWTVFLKRHTDGLVSIDLSEKRLKIAKELNKDVNFILCDARNLPFKDKSFDSICAIAIIEHLPTYAEHHKFLKEVTRVLKEKGLFLMSTPNRPIYKIHSMLTGGDPTHFSELNYFQLSSILKQYFCSVKICGKFGWLSPLYKFLPLQFIHKFLSKLTPLCKELYAICRKNIKFSNFK